MPPQHKRKHPCVCLKQLTWISIFPMETKGVLSSVRNRQPMKKSPMSFLKNWGADREHTQAEQTNSSMGTNTADSQGHFLWKRAESLEGRTSRSVLSSCFTFTTFLGPMDGGLHRKSYIKHTSSNVVMTKATPQQRSLYLHYRPLPSLLMISLGKWICRCQNTDWSN